MEETVKIVIPSMGRPNRVLAYAIPNSVICVPESEVDAYAKNYDRERIVAHPDSVLGIGAKRNWIIESFPNVFMIDDDYSHLVRVYMSKDDDLPLNATPEETYEIIQATAFTAKQLGAKMFGFARRANPMYYSGQRPFATDGAIYFGAGILEGSQIFIPDEFYLLEDSFMSLINIYYNRFCFIDSRFSYPFKDNVVGKEEVGGCSSYRSVEMAISCANLLQRYFGSSHVQVNMSPESLVDAGKDDILSQANGFSVKAKIV